MVQHSSRGSLRFLSHFSSRVRELSKNPLYRKRALGILSVVLSMVLALHAQRVSGDSALKSWIHDHPPSERLWLSALSAHGLTEITDPTAVQKAVRLLPTSMDPEPSCWISENNLWAVVFTDPYGTRPLRAFALNKKEKPPAIWIPLGAGWNGLESLLNRLSELKPDRSPSDQGKSPVRAQSVWRDKRAIDP